MDSNALIPSGFSTQGTIDWVSLADKTVSVSLGILSRCSAAGVDPYTLAVGGIVTKKLVLSPQGHRNIQDALAQLKSYSGFGNVLWFGFGVRSLVRTLGMRDEWRSLLAYCACLSECFPEEYAAEVVHDLVVAHHSPEEMTPSVGEWLMVIKACAGCVSTTKFPVLAEGFMRLALPAARAASGKFSEVPHKIQPQARDLNNAVIALSHVASGDLSRVAIVADTVAAGWIAAVAKWLFNLSIAFEDSAGQVVYCDSSMADQAQVVIQSNEDGKSKDRALTLASQTYFLNGASDFVRRGQMSITGRLQWDTCLQSTFGQDFDDLISHPTDVGAFIGSAARIYTGIVRAEPGISVAALSRHAAYFANSHGSGLIRNTLKWFPEMKPCGPSMEQSARLSLEDAVAEYEKQRLRLQDHCQCWSKTVDGKRYHARSYCLVELANTILWLSQHLAGLDVDPELLPTRTGIEAAHSEIFRISHSQSLPIAGPISQVWKNGKDQYTHLEEIKAGMGNRLAAAMTLFTGQRPSDFDATASALSSKGICAYFDVLCDISLDRDSVGLVHVVPGQLGRNQRSFRAVVDQSSQSTYPASAKQAVAIMPLLENVSMMVTEGVDSLRVAYILSANQQDPQRASIRIQCGPRDIVQSICAGRGRIRFPCPKYQCQDEMASIRRDIEENDQERPLLTLKVNGKKMYRYGGVEAKTLGRVGALLLNANFVASWPEPITPHCIFSDSDCMDCCVYQIGMQDTDNFPLII
ncbi:hypothetical protein BDV19DRAFT_374297 [Aspergillus venezuelensis]